MTYRRWLCILIAVPLATAVALTVATVVAAKIIRLPDYAARIADPSVVVQEKAFVAHDLHCDVLIAGDSTALNGIDPRVITRQTGMSACNIASTRPIWDATGTLPLDTFLAHNARPKVLLLQFGPELFYRTSDWENIPPVSPYVLLLRQGAPGLALRTILLHPVQTLQVLEVVYKLELQRHTPEHAARSRFFERAIAGYEASGGRLDLELPGVTACNTPAEELYGPLDSKWIADLRHKYEALGMVTLVDAAPLPVCDPQLDLFRRDLAPYVDANTTGLPAVMFVTGDRHMTSEGANYQSTVVARQIQAALASHAAHP